MISGSQGNKISFERTKMIRLHSIDEAVEEEEIANDEENVRDTENSFDSVAAENFNLFSAVSKKDVSGIRRALLEGADVNARTKPMRITALHVACAQGDEGSVAVLLKAGAEPKAADKLGRTPLHMASTIGSAQCVALLLKAGASPDVVYQVKTMPQRLRVEDMQTESKSGMVSLEKLLLNLPFPDCWERTPLHQAVKSNSPICAKLLLEAGASIDPLDESGNTPLLLAGEGVQVKDKEELENYEDVIEVLLSYDPSVDVTNNENGFTPLHRAAQLYSERSAKALLRKGAKPLRASDAGGYSTAIHLAAESAASGVLDVILKSARDDYNRQVYTNVGNQKGFTPLHLAIYAGCHACVALLIDAGADLASVAHNGLSALDALFLHLPRAAQFLSGLLDSRIRTNAVPVEERSFTLLLDFRILAPHGKDKQTGVMRVLLEAKSADDETRHKLLVHPIVKAFIVLKWRRLRLFFYVLVFVHVAFTLSFSAYITIIHSEIAYATALAFTKAMGKQPELPKENQLVLNSIIVSRHVLMFSSTVVLLNVLGQCVTLPRYYLRQFEFWMNLITTILAFIVVSENSCDGIPGCSFDFSNQYNSTISKTRRMNVQHITSPEMLHLTVIAILFAWAELMVLFGRFPTRGSYGQLFFTVFKNVFEVFLAFGCLVIGFSFSFFVQFHLSEPEAFGNPLRAFVKTIVMMMGEFDYLNLYGGSDKAPTGMLAVTSRIIFVCFVVLASMVLVNLMVGLAVSDTQALHSEGEARRLLKQAEFVAHLERGVSAVVHWKWLPKRLILHLSKRRSIDTILVVKPSDIPAHRTGHLSRRLIDDLVAIALRMREEERKKSLPRHLDGIFSNLFNANDAIGHQEVTMFQILQNISKSLTDIKEMLEPRFGAPRNQTPSVLRDRKWSSARIPRARFSDVVSEVSGAQKILRQLSESQDEKNSPV